MKNFKEVHSFDINGLYMGKVKAHKSPLEKDVFLMPANSTDEIPELKEGGICKFVNGKWKHKEIPKEVEFIVTGNDLLEDAKEILAGELKYLGLWITTKLFG